MMSYGKSVEEDTSLQSRLCLTVGRLSAACARRQDAGFGCWRGARGRKAGTKGAVAQPFGGASLLHEVHDCDDFPRFSARYIGGTCGFEETDLLFTREKHTRHVCLERQMQHSVFPRFSTLFHMFHPNDNRITAENYLVGAAIPNGHSQFLDWRLISPLSPSFAAPL